MRFRVEVQAVCLIAAAAALYVAVAYGVKPGFYDCCAAPNYDYVAPPKLLASGNVQPTSGAGGLQVSPGGTVSGGVITTRDQPIPQATVVIVGGTLVAPASGGSVAVQLKPFAPSTPTDGIVLQGNVYCVTSNTTFKPKQQGLITLSVPPYGPFATTMYAAASRGGPWTAIGGKFDLNNYQTTAEIGAFGCFALGYPIPHPGQQPTIGGSIVPVVTAIAIAIVLLAGLPLALRRRRPQSADSEASGTE